MINNEIQTDANSVASQHGVDIQTVGPESFDCRMQKLSGILADSTVPFPIPEDVAKNYLDLARTGRHFAIGTLTDQTVDLSGFENEQHYDALTFEDHLSWACLVADQQSEKHRYACREYIDGEKKFEIRGASIPDYFILNARIYQQTGWQLATVSEIIPAHVFFHCHSRRFFPVTTFMRPLGTDYLEEPDIGHDIAGHVATFTIPQVAMVMNNHGLANDMILREKNEKLQLATTDIEKKQIEDNATELLLYAGRLYWFTVEFGLVQQAEGMKAFGAGILSSPGETRFSVESSQSNRILIDPSVDRDLLRLATTDYLISEFQKTYFVLKNFRSLETLTPERILSTVKKAQRLPHHTWRELAPGDAVINVGKTMTSPNEKYFRLIANQPLDDCLYRTAVRNLRMAAEGFDMRSQCEQSFVDDLPLITEDLIQSFVTRDRAGQFSKVD